MARVDEVVNQPITNISGHFELSNINISDNTATVMEIVLAYNTPTNPTIWPDPQTILNAQAHIRRQGNTYQLWSTFATYGGPHFEWQNPLLVQLSETSWFFTLPMNTNRRLKFVVDVAGPPLNTILNVRTYDPSSVPQIARALGVSG